MNESSIKSKPCTEYERVADICLVQKISADERAAYQNSSSVFPRWSIITWTPIAFDRPMSEVIHYSFLPVKGFSKDEWCEVWGGEEVGIDECLSQNPHGTKFPHVFQETEFLTIPFRLIIDPAKAYQLPKLSRGTIISFANCNSLSHRYIIDTCVFSNSNNAFLRVIGFNENQEVFNTNSSRPPFILQIPVSFCSVKRSYSIEQYKCALELETVHMPRKSYQQPEESTGEGHHGWLQLILGVFTKCKCIHHSESQQDLILSQHSFDPLLFGRCALCICGTHWILSKFIYVLI